MHFSQGLWGVFAFPKEKETLILQSSKLFGLNINNNQNGQNYGEFRNDRQEKVGTYRAHYE